MPKIRYENLNLSAGVLAVIKQANEIIEEYAEQGFDLTLRQLYYQFVARDLIPNEQKSYKRLGDIVSKGRRAGLIDWERIVDRTRELRRRATWENPQEIIAAVAQQFRLDLWEDQEYRVEVWIEKDALLGVLEAACLPHRVPYFSCRGFGSDSEMWAAGQRMKVYRSEKKTPIVIHLGDHDPSGIVMSEDIEGRLELFSGRPVEVRRIALNMDQVNEFNPPPNPAKETDSRFARYQEEFGDESWELDALDPTTISDLIAREIRGLRDNDLWEEAKRRELHHRDDLTTVSTEWEVALQAACDAFDEREEDRRSEYRNDLEGDDVDTDNGDDEE